MRLPFRQGIVTAQSDFIQLKFPYVKLVITNAPLVLTISAGPKNYLWTEKDSVTNAWGPLTQGQDAWLYWDLDVRTGVRTFGMTIYAPVVSSVSPPAPLVNQHWYDTSAKLMKVWIGATWQAKNRVFACKMVGGSVPVSLSANSPSYIGSQVGDSVDITAGHLLFDADNLPIKGTDGKFITTEDSLRSTLTSTANVKVASIVVEAQAVQNLAKYTIVKFSDFGQIVAADASTASSIGQYGIIESDVITGDMVQIATTGIITNLDWDWAAVGVNAPLYCDANGVLSATPTAAGQMHVATVIDRHAIQLGRYHIVDISKPTPMLLQLSCSDLTTSLTPGLTKAYCYAPVAFVLTEVRASLLTPSTLGPVVLNVSVLGQPVSFATGDTTTAVTPTTITTITDNSLITVDITNAGTDATGLMVTLIGTLV